MDLTVLYILGGFMVFWVAVVGLAAFKQELGVGWSEFSFMNKVCSNPLHFRTPFPSD